MKNKKSIINLEKLMYVAGLSLVFFLCAILLLDIIINGNNCCSKHINLGLSCICNEPKIEKLWNISEMIKYDFSVPILIFSTLFGVYTFYYLIKTKRVKRNIWCKIIITIGILCTLYFILFGIGNFYINNYF